MDIKKIEIILNGTLAIIVLVTYCAVTIISLVNWNESISSALIMGFALLAKDVVAKMFDLLKQRGEQEVSVVAATPVVIPPVKP